MPIRVTCGKCHTRFNVSEQFAGKEGPCPKCKTKIRIPTPEEAVVIEAPKPKGAVDSKGQSVLKPIRRKETKLSSVQLTLIISSIVAFLIAALMMRVMLETPSDLPSWLLVIAAIVLAFPLAFVAYAFLRDQDLEGFRGNELWIRTGICSAVYALSWIALPIAAFAFNGSYEAASYISAGVVMFGVGTLAATMCFEFDWIIGAAHYGLYMGVGLLGRFLAGIGTLPVTLKGSRPTTTTTTTTSMLEGWEFFLDCDWATTISLAFQTSMQVWMG